MTTEHPIVPRPGDTILIETPGDKSEDTSGEPRAGTSGAAPVRLVHVARVVRPYACAATADERRYGCYWVIGDDDEEYVVTAEVSGRYTRTFHPRSGS